jgi:branched-chain amino acid transport system ATP-binding protein
MPPVPALQLESVTHRYGAAVAVADVSLRVAAGERRVLLGANGAGKTTLFNIILGDLMPGAGRILLFGSDVSRLAPHCRIRLGMRRTYQTSSTFVGLTVRECLFLAVRGVAGGRFAPINGVTGRADMEAATIAGRKVGLEAVLDTCAGALSHGERRQLEIGMATVGEPRLLLLDEPAAGLSPAERQWLLATLRGLPRSITLVMIEHDVDLALAVADRVTLMRDGRLVVEGSPDTIATSRDVHDIYLSRRA